MTRLRVSALGPLQVTVDGRPASFPYDKVTALLTYLVVEAGHAHSRDSLAEMLWPDRPSSTSRHSLSQALTTLRKILAEPRAGSPTLGLTRDSIRLDAHSDIWLDAAELTVHLAAVDRHRHPASTLCTDCVAELESAVALYRGDFLAQFSLADSATFEHWALTRRTAYREQVLRALTRLSDHAEQTGDLDSACRQATRQLELDPWRETAHRQLMRLLALSGQRNAAIAQYERCRQVLIAELELEPEAETTALYEHIKTGGLRAPSAQALPRAPRHNLRAPSTPLIGREAETAHLAALLGDPTCRLVTLLGPGGIGKTRLALQAAHEQVARFADGVWFVSLAALSSPDLIPSAIAEALNFTPYGADDLRAKLLEHLRPQHVLLVLDDFEQVSAGAALLPELIAGAPDLKLLVTSRERLDLHGEWVFELEGLSLPATDDGPDVAQSGAVRLFAQNARRVQPAFTLQPNVLAAVARVCRLVDGMPLGIELATAWLPVLSPEEIAREIAHSLDFLAVDRRDVPRRHQSLRAVFDQSWHLLTEPERAIFRRLSVFRGGFTREAAAAVAGAALLDLARLAAKSLIRRSTAGRFEIHELLRQYGARHLQDCPDDEALAREQHSHYYLAFLAARETALKGFGQQTALTEIAGETENLRVAWEWATGQGQAVRIAQSIDAFWLFNEVSGRYGEAELQFRQAAEALERAPIDLPGRALALGKALACQGSWLMRLGQPDQLRALGGRSLALLRPLNARREIAFTLNMVAAAARVQGAYAEERQLLEESIALGKAAGDRWIVGYSLNDLGMATYLLGDAAEARRVCAEGLAIFRATGDQRGMAFALNNLGAITRDLGDVAEAEALLQEALTFWRDSRHRWGVATTLLQLGVTARLRHDPVLARARFLESVQTATAVRTWPPALDALVELAALDLAKGDRATAVDLLRAVRQHPACPAAAQAKATQLLADNALPREAPTTDVAVLVDALLRTQAPVSL